MKVKRRNLKHGSYAERARGRAGAQRDGEKKTSGQRQVYKSERQRIYHIIKEKLCCLQEQGEEDI